MESEEDFVGATADPFEAKDTVCEHEDDGLYDGKINSVGKRRHGETASTYDNAHFEVKLPTRRA